MKRRDFIAMLAGSVAISPWVARAQHGSRERLIGVLSPISREAAGRNVDALKKGLQELGYVEGRDIRLVIKYSDGAIEALPQLASELVALNPDVIVAGSPPAAIAVRKATLTIPIIMNSSPDPVALGLAANLARPGGNVTGFWWGDEGLIGKRLEILKQAAPGIERAGFIFNPDDPTDGDAINTLAAVSKRLGLAVQLLETRDPVQLDAAFATAKREGLQGLVLGTGPLLVSERGKLARLALDARLPMIGSFRDYAVVGALASYGANLSDLYRRKAAFIDRIFKGAKPEDMPIERPVKFEFVLNLKTAQAFSLAISPSLLAQVDEVLE